MEENATLYGITKLINISSGAIFGFLPLAVAYSTVKRFGGRPIMGIVMGCIMLSSSLADAYAAAQGTVEVQTLHIFGIGVDLIGFQGGIIVALLIGVVTAKLDIFFEKKIPEVIRLLVSPLLTTIVSAFLLFMVIGPVGRGLASGITSVLVWMTENLGVVGYAAFSGVQQLIVITGLHHVFGAIETQLLVDTGRNFLNPLMSVAIIAQGGAVFGYLAKNRRDAKARELCIPSFVSVLFGITEPALFGINLRYRYPIIGGCLGGAIGGAIVYFTNLAALGFGTTVVPGIALVDPAGNGYVNYILAHLAALAAGFIFTVVLAAVFTRQPQLAEADAPVADRLAPAQDSTQAAEETVAAFGNGHLVDITRVNDATFAQKVLGDGVAIQTEDGKVYAPVDAVIEDIMDAKHAIGLRSNSGHEFLIHAGIDTVQLGGQYFTTHVKAGETVKKGTLLLTFDQNEIQQAGYDTIVSLIITEMADGFTLTKTEECDVKVGQTIAKIVKM